MKKIHLVLLGVLLSVTISYGQGTIDDYKRAYSLPEKFRNLIPGANVYPRWLGDTHSFWYVNNTSAGDEYILVDADKKKRTIMPDSMKQRLQAEAAQMAGRRSSRYWGEWDDEKTGDSIPSPDKQRIAFIKNSNVYVKEVASGQIKALSNDGAAGEYYSTDIRWSPDSRKLAVMKIRPAERQYFYMVESSPADQLQPKLHTREYAKPGDALPFYVPHIFHVESGQHLAPSTELFASQYYLARLEWEADSKSVLFEYNQRGHQVYRVLEFSAETGLVRPLIEETSDTFVNYRRYFRKDLAGTNEIIWMSERDNWNHLYLIDKASAKVKAQITKGEWYVREVLYVDEENRLIYFSASGMAKKEDPYLVRYYRINIDGSGLTCLSLEEGMHTAWFSADRKYMVDVWSKVDVAPKAVLRDGKDGKILMELESPNLTALKEAGWIAPEPFVAKGRDNKTDIWGVIYRPTNFDPKKKYPVIEYIYAGPGSAYTQKAFRPFMATAQQIAELGFIVVQCDGMGTSFRSKAFESIIYKNLKDAGFPDRKAWIKAAANKYPFMDIEKVGIYGASAGGQEAMWAVLFHPEFYKAAYAACGCHDNRMDKIWWNEQWMGYPVDSSYIACSNVENAHLLTRPLMLMVGELDDNVDPASTMQVANALIKAGKEFELVIVPGMNHTLGGDYGDRKRFDFFVKHLLNVTPPDWNLIGDLKKSN
ncbi:dipeptidyl aminopeptidase/acylaminoacyl peptidase [Parabacteroides sp. PF5-5]|uniref:S9 family peptidase n=1 Tax=unclassified Parabacteroides TaxID=2649774 RepID=UPI002474646E|nr:MULTISPECIES: S9 family peptidase [unclassified Parabacteroides]MDH6304191.1 dipeptidyl aminopeptidase/acylaminoacyl peptidase [Parabacteroides sp. PH5-39]MDH6315093.1 dipeptidyl aminopeptidase/acylaminoacyl peptidase [Parabacteroides sp. PF5-13]MDH6318754.1 dipeptidyl aminopeptidase/acylaminoacyl peptidase [Parabacteroides sp. PH5-13]MDH6322483.1 dipeptidyl aminopeptidase/acylaminoacyl peptidase [Parabacteroides sp. PH5-8]MDH6326381.1 dipeptidyl aminopeptidase/acylaminoacyl peptidase [Para